jgi:hypothetical protein
MRKLLLGALAAAGLVFAGCERQQPAGYGEPTLEGTGGAGDTDNDLRFLDDGREVDDGTGGAGFPERDPREHDGLDGSGPESTLEDHESDPYRDYGEDSEVQSEGGAVPQ